MHPDHSQCPELRAKLGIIGLTFKVSRYFNPAFNFSHTEEVPPYFQSAMVHSQVERVGQVSGGRPSAFSNQVGPCRARSYAPWPCPPGMVPSLLHGLVGFSFSTYHLGRDLISCPIINALNSRRKGNLLIFFLLLEYSHPSLSQVHSHYYGCILITLNVLYSYLERNRTLLVSLFKSVGIFFQLSISHTEEVPSYFQSCHGLLSQVERVGQVSGGWPSAFSNQVGPCRA